MKELGFPSGDSTCLLAEFREKWQMTNSDPDSSEMLYSKSGV
jgi:hypothetical protein